MSSHSNLEHSSLTKSYCIIFRRPAIWYMKYAKRAEHPRRLQHTDETETPKCKVSISSSNDLRETSDQPQSSFCSLLPTEIRLEIYKYVLCGRRLHLRYGDGIKRPYICRYPCLLEDVASSWDHYMCWNQNKPPLDNLLPLLQSCRFV
jgi:hypothetical protein